MLGEHVEGMLTRDEDVGGVKTDHKNSRDADSKETGGDEEEAWVADGMKSGSEDVEA